MIHSKSIEVFKTFSKEELKHFSDFIRSPFHNKNKNLVKLFDTLKKYHPNYEAENEIIYSKVYPGKSYSYDNIKKLMSDMMTVAYNFLIQMRFKENNITQKLILLRQFDLKKLDHLFLSCSEKLERELEKEESKFYEKYKLQKYINDFYENREKYKNAVDHLFKRSIYSVQYLFHLLDSDTNDTTTCKIKFNFKSKKLFLTDIFNNNFDYDSFLKNIRENNFDSEYLKLKCNSLLLFKNPGKEIYFEEAEKSLLNMNKSLLSRKLKFSANGKQNILLKEIIKLRNYCDYMAINQAAKNELSKKKYARKSFELCKLDLEVRKSTGKGEFLVEKSLYNSIVQIGMELDENEFVEQFINTYKINADKEEQKNMLNFARSYLELNKKNFEESLKFASECSIDGWLEKNKLKQIILICFYELDHLESAVSLVDSYNHYLSHTQELPGNFKKVFKDYLYFYNELLKLKLYNEKIDDFIIRSLRSRLSKKFILYHNWFHNKLKELENSNINGKG